MILFASVTCCFSSLWISVWTGTHMLGLILSTGFHCLLLFVCCSLCPICIRWQGITIQMNYTVSLLFIMSESVFCRMGQRYRGDIVIRIFRWVYKSPFTPAPTLHFTALFWSEGISLRLQGKLGLPYNVKKCMVQICTMFLCGSVVEHCVSSAKGCGFDSQGTHLLMKMYNLNAL